MLYLKHPERKLRHFIAMPLIVSMIIPIVIMDGWIEIYHRIAFYMYDIRYIKRRQYIKLDRHRLQYLNWPQKLYVPTAVMETELFVIGHKLPLPLRNIGAE